MLHKHPLAAALLLLLLLLGVASVSADKQVSTALGFGEWLGKIQFRTPNKAVSSSVAPAPEYEGVEVLHTCLEDVKKINCASGSVFFYGSALGCCGGKSHHNELVLKPTTVGQCEFTLFYLEDPVQMAENILKLSTFIALCYFDKKADECGEPFCDKMVLIVRGDHYLIENAIVHSTLRVPDADINCFNITKRMSARHGGSHKAAAILEAAYEPYHEPRYYKGADYHHPTSSLYQASFAEVLYGTFTVNSRLHSVKYDQGWFEYVPNYSYYYDGGLTPITEDQAGDTHVLDPYKYKLSFFKKQSY